MKNIFKLLLASFLLTVIFACDNDADRDWTTPEASFKLYDTTLGSNILYETMKDNPFILNWDKTGSSNYDVVFSATEDFANKIKLGTSNTNNYITTIGAINTALLQAGFSPYSPTKVYIRIESGAEISNSISLDLTTYPIAGPIVTAPTAGSSLVLNSADQSAIATTITWNDYSSYGVNVKYLVEVAKTGTTSFVSIGEVTIPNPNPDNITRSLKVTNKDLNTAVVNTGATINQANDIDIRITATTTSTGGSIVLQSAVVTFKVTPYQVDYPDFFLVGGATAAGWTPGAAPKLYKKDNISEIYTYLQPDNFRFLGQADWNPLNYSIDDPRTNASNRYFKTTSSNVEFGDAENMKFTGVAGIYKIVIDADFSKKSITVTPTESVWDIPKLYLVGSIQGWQANVAEEFNSIGNGKFQMIRELPDGAQFKFLGQQDWTGKEWGNIHKNNEGNSGFLGINDDNSNITFDGGGSFYTITVDLKMGTYTIVKI
ncbi:SusE domain-containing protein [Epilithonimonas hungarica]|uniref:SusE outer membrane protein n=1 Tax=Epilithonimonas hungarica TaxID=454006 RepID=A0A1G7MG01_9FLAO|nr:SusE domain-containing protein [Epilithonimonas hungarica]SDF60752.1 SusE outer membrane protein [Epilithonimonas hungarica]